jgi:hypothetical protein
VAAVAAVTGRASCQRRSVGRLVGGAGRGVTGLHASGLGDDSLNEGDIRLVRW